jgi:sporulation protein YlmC with PRC-barrel domain
MAAEVDEREDRVTLGKGEVVLDSEGHDLGVVEEVLLDQRSGELQGFVLRVGGMWKTLFGGGDRVTVHRDAVREVGEGTVQLNVVKEDLRAA